MSKKNSNVNLKNGFENFRDLSKIYLNFRNKLDSIHKKKFAVAVSGGPDSLALVALTKAYTYYKKSKFFYVLIDHNIRKNSHLEAKKVQKILKKKQINLKVILNKNKIKKNYQAEARNVRYKYLTKFCVKNKIKTLLTAHTLEDQVETFFIRLSRGSGLRGLSGMKPENKINNKVYLFRPFLDVKKSSLTKISKITFNTFIKDPSNKDLKYLRTKIRNLKKPLEKSGIEYDQIFRSIQNLSISKATLDKYQSQIIKELIIAKNNKVLINYNKFNEQNDEIKMTLINSAIKKLKNNYYDLRSKKVANLIKNMRHKNFKRSTLGGCIFYKSGIYLCLIKEKL